MSQRDGIDNIDRESSASETELNEPQIRRSSRERLPSYRMLQHMEQELSENYWRKNSSCKRTIREIQDKIAEVSSNEILEDFAKSLRDLERALTSSYDELRIKFTVSQELRLGHDRTCAEIDRLIKVIIQSLMPREESNMDQQSKFSGVSLTSSRKLELAARAAALHAEKEARQKETEAKKALSYLETQEEIRKAKYEAELVAQKARQEADERERQLKVELELDEKRQELENKRLNIEIEKNKAELRELNRLDGTLEQANPYLEPLPRESLEQSYNRMFKVQPPFQATGQLYEPFTNYQSGLPQIHDITVNPSRGHGDNPLQQLYTRPCQDNEMKEETCTTDVVKTLVESMNLCRLPAPEPLVFTGDPLSYPTWKASFDTLVSTKGIAPSERIHYLRKYLAGEAKSVVEGTFYLRSEEAFTKAISLLEKRYGNSFLVSEAFRDKLQAFPKISARDSKSLRKYSDLLQQCLIAMDQVQGLEILNDCRENRKLLSKLPDWLVQRWARIVNGKESYPSFREFTEYLSREADIACNPVTTLTYTERGQQENSRVKGNSRSRTLAVASSVNGPNKQLDCFLCKRDGQNLHNCSIFKKKTPAERKDFLMKHGICFGCLSKGHRSKDCTNRTICSKCSRKHPTNMHGDYEALNENTVPKTVSNNKKSEDIKTAVSNRTFQDTKKMQTSMIVPVYISSMDRPYDEYLTYAMLDTQSDTTFILEETSEKLNIRSETTKLKLSTLTSTTTIDCRRFRNLQVRGLNSLTRISLPVTYSREVIPVHRSQIPTSDTAKGWPHLSQLQSTIPPDLNCEVGLLIGYNCPQAMAPKAFISGTGNEPFAQETELGWSIVGTVASSYPNQDCDEIGLSHRIVTTMVPNSLQMNGEQIREVHYVYKATSTEEFLPQITKLLESDFPERKYEDKMISQDDIRFLKILEEGIHRDKDGYYEMPLPFRTSNPCMPNNRMMAVKRLGHLKRKFVKDQRYQRDYIRFMEEIIQRREAEEINEKVEPQNVWYILHHGVYHPKKPDKIRVVFDCSAKYKTTSLNDHLLQGPNNINNLVGVLPRFREDKIAVMGDIERMFHQFKV